MSFVNKPEWGVFLWLVSVWAWVIWSLPSANCKSRGTHLSYIFILIANLKNPNCL